MRKKSDRCFEIYSHRCLGFGHKENSLAAVVAALSSDVTGIEIDARLTKDKKWVVIHDPYCVGEKRSVLRVHEKSYSSLKKEVTLLETIFALFAALGKKKKMLLDVKDVGMIDELVGMIQDYSLQKQVVVICWEPEIIRMVHKKDKSIMIGLSYVPIHSKMDFIKGAIDKPLTAHNIVMRFNKDHYFDEKLSKGLVHQHYLSYIPDIPLYSIQVPSSLCSKKLVDLAHSRKIKVIPFVVNTKIMMRLLRNRDVDGVLTNKPLALRLSG